MEADKEILGVAVKLAREIAPIRAEPDTLTWDESLALDTVVVKYGEVKP